MSRRGPLSFDVFAKPTFLKYALVASVAALLVALASANIVAASIRSAPAHDYVSIIRDSLIGLGFLALFASPLALAFFVVRRGVLDQERHPEGRCAQCRYDLRGLPGPRCPECGSTLDRPPRTTSGRA